MSRIINNDICIKLAKDPLGRLTIYTDGNQFIVDFIGGHAEAFYTFGYSCPNGADISEAYITSEQLIDLKKFCQSIIDEHSHESENIVEALFSIVQKINSKYNELIF